MKKFKSCLWSSGKKIHMISRVAGGLLSSSYHQAVRKKGGPIEFEERLHTINQSATLTLSISMCATTNG